MLRAARDQDRERAARVVLLRSVRDLRARLDCCLRGKLDVLHRDVRADDRRLSCRASGARMPTSDPSGIDATRAWPRSTEVPLKENSCTREYIAVSSRRRG